MSATSIVYVVDDDPDVRESIETLGRSVRLNVKTYGSAQEFLDDFTYSDHEAPCCLVVDVRLPGISGLELQRRLNEWKMSIPTIIVTGYAEVSMAVRALKAGAIDFLEKPFGGQELLDRIQRALEKQRQNQWKQRRDPDVSSRLAALSPREKEVMDHLVHGKNTKQVGSSLGISPKTVAKHRASLLEKTGVDSVVELLRLIGTDELGAVTPCCPRATGV